VSKGGASVLAVDVALKRVGRTIQSLGILHYIRSSSERIQFALCSHSFIRPLKHHHALDSARHGQRAASLQNKAMTTTTTTKPNITACKAAIYPTKAQKGMTLEDIKY